MEIDINKVIGKQSNEFEIADAMNKAQNEVIESLQIMISTIINWDDKECLDINKDRMREFVNKYLLDEKVFCNYKKTFDAPYPRVEYKSDCGFLHVVCEGYKIGTSNERLDEYNLPKGKCMKCAKEIKS